MKLKAIAPWFGSKRRLAPAIVRQLGTHISFWDVFCGSCAVLMAKPKSTHECVNELHADLINLALVLQDEEKAKELYGRTARTLYHEGVGREARRRLAGSCDPAGCTDRAYWYMVCSWFHIHGTAGLPLCNIGTVPVCYRIRGGSRATHWLSTVDSIPYWHERLRGVQILRRDAFKLLENIEDAAGTVIYVDPPYITKCTKYLHDFAAADHYRLASLLYRFKKTRVVLSYYDHPEVADLYKTWSRVECTVDKSMARTNRRGTRGRVGVPEVLFINGDVLGYYQYKSMF